MTHLRVAVDIGGTFTDICILDDRDDSLEITKVPSTTEKTPLLNFESC